MIDTSRRYLLRAANSPDELATSLSKALSVRQPDAEQIMRGLKTMVQRRILPYTFELAPLPFIPCPEELWP